MTTKNCPIHNVDMRMFEKDGRSWFSHKADDGTWCKGFVPQNQTISSVTKPETRTYQGRPQIEWDMQGREKALCGFINGMLSAGKDPKQIEIADLLTLLSKVETAAEFMTKDKNPPNF